MKKIWFQWIQKYWLGNKASRHNQNQFFSYLVGWLEHTSCPEFTISKTQFTIFYVNMKSFAIKTNNFKGIMRFCLLGYKLSIGQMCCVLLTKARIWPITLQSIHLFRQIISYQLIILGKISVKFRNFLSWIIQTIRLSSECSSQICNESEFLGSQLNSDSDIVFEFVLI